MTSKNKLSHDPLREAQEFRDQAGSLGRKLVFFLGAGTSQAVGLDDITDLTKRVQKCLTDPLNKHYARLLSQAGTNATVEQVLDIVRLCRELIGDSIEREVNGLKNPGAIELDRSICRHIYDAIKIEPPDGLGTHAKFASWLKFVDRENPVEVYTTNYDLLIERGMEHAETPYFDGFIGAVSPYFVAATVEADFGHTHPLCPPRTWVRVWKLHGSIGWRQVTAGSGQQRIVRTPNLPPNETDDLMIFPSRQKYTDSRKQPYVAYHDRFRRLLSSGEALLVVLGYSFGDQHINEVIFEALRANNRLAVTVFSYDPLSAEDVKTRLLRHARELRNLTVYGPDEACVGGILGPWSDPTQPPPAWLGKWPFWDEVDRKFTLGNFVSFVEFLEGFLSPRNPVEHIDVSATSSARSGDTSTDESDSDSSSVSSEEE